MGETPVDALEQIRAIYAELPDIACRGMCANSCGPIDMSDTERDRLVDLGVRIPVFTSKDARAWAAGARLDCPALTSMRTCRVYADRPLICRLWGVAASMPCEHGCVPRRTLSDDEAYELIFRVNEIGGHREFGTSSAIRSQWEALRADPELGPLFARFIRGETDVEKQITDLLRARKQTDNSEEVDDASTTFRKNAHTRKARGTGRRNTRRQ